MAVSVKVEVGSTVGIAAEGVGGMISGVGEVGRLQTDRLAGFGR